MDAGEALSFALRIRDDSLQFAHMVSGINSGLYDALVRHGEQGALPQELAQELHYFEDYVRVWCEFGYSVRILDDAGDGRFRLSEGFRFWFSPSAPVRIADFLRARQLHVEEQFEFPDFLRTGAVRSFQDHGERLSRLVVGQTENLTGSLVDQVYGKVPELKLKLEQGCRVLEIGCGLGRLPMALANTFPKSFFVGTDPDHYAIEAGQAELRTKGLGDRVELRQVGAESLDFHEEFDIVSLVMTMHELASAIRPRAVANMHRALRPGGLLVSIDFYYPGSLEDFRKPEFSMAVQDQATEVVWGNRHLSQAKLAELFASSGFQRSEFQVFQFPLLPAPFLTSLAYK